MNEVAKRLIHRIDHIEKYMSEGNRVLLVQTQEEFKTVKYALKCLVLNRNISDFDIDKVEVND